MRLEFETLDQLWVGAAKEVFVNGGETGSRDGDTLESLGFSARLNNPYAHLMLNPVRKMRPSYAAAELLWYLSGERTADRILPYAPQYKRFLDGGEAFGAYGWRWANDPAYELGKEETGSALNGKPTTTQLLSLVWLLIQKPDTRQAILTMWNAGDLAHAVAGDKHDIPCTLSLQFLQRAGKLNCIATMRSNDLWLGLPYDVFCFTSLQILIAEALNIPVGWYQHNVGSLHLYDRNRDAAMDARITTKTPEWDSAWEYDTHGTKVSSATKIAVEGEAYGRQNKKVPIAWLRILGADSLLGQSVIMAMTKWTSDAASHIDNPQLKRYIACLS